MKNVKSVLFVALSLALFASCSSDDDDKMEKSSVKVSIKTTMGKEELPLPFELTTFQINISEIEFDVSEGSKIKLPQETKLNKSSPINLLSDKASSGIVVATTNISNATYKEVELKLDVYNEENDSYKELKSNSVYASGFFSLDGTNQTDFVIKSEKKLEVELEYEENLELNGTSTNVLIDLNIDKIIQELVVGISKIVENPPLGFELQFEEDGSLQITKDKNQLLLTAFENSLIDGFTLVE